MKRHRISDNVPMIVGEGRKIFQRSAKRAGETASKVARQGRKWFGSTVHGTERMTRRKPWVGLGSAIGTGFILGGLCAFLFYRGR